MHPRLALSFKPPHRILAPSQHGYRHAESFRQRAERKHVRVRDIVQRSEPPPPRPYGAPGQGPWPKIPNAWVSSKTRKPP